MPALPATVRWIANIVVQTLKPTTLSALGRDEGFSERRNRGRTKPSGTGIAGPSKILVSGVTSLLCSIGHGLVQVRRLGCFHEAREHLANFLDVLLIVLDLLLLVGVPALGCHRLGQKRLKEPRPKLPPPTATAPRHREGAASGFTPLCSRCS